MNKSEHNNLTAFGVMVARLGLKDPQEILRLAKRVEIFVARAKSTQQTKSLTLKGKDGSFFFRISPNGNFEIDSIPVAKPKPKITSQKTSPTPPPSRANIVAKLIKKPDFPLASESLPQPEPSHCSPRQFLELLDYYGFKKLLERDKDLFRFMGMNMDDLVQSSEARGLLKFRFKQAMEKGPRAGRIYQKVASIDGKGTLAFQFNPKGQGRVQVNVSYTALDFDE